MHLGVWLAHQPYRIDYIYTSPFYRTVHTAQLIHGQIIQGNRDNKQNINLFTPPPDPLDQLFQMNKQIPLQIRIENGLVDEPDWLATNAKPTKPWYLKSGDFAIISNDIEWQYQSINTPVWEDGDCYPGRPIEINEVYDRCSSTIWRIIREPSSNEKTIVIISHAGPIMNMIHALTGRGVVNPMRHTCITSVVFDQTTGMFIIEKEQLPTLTSPYQTTPNEVRVGEEIFCSVRHLAENMRT